MPGSTTGAGRDGVLEQAVGLVGAQLVLVGDHVLVAGDGRHSANERGHTVALEQRLRCAAMRTVYLGTSEFAVAVLERLALSPHRPAAGGHAPDRPRGRGRKVAPPPVAEAAASSASS